MSLGDVPIATVKKAVVVVVEGLSSRVFHSLSPG